MLVVTDLESAMKAAVNGMTDPAAANTALGNAISNYINTNAEVTFSWAAAQTAPPPPTGAPDPLLVANGKVSGVAIVLTPSGSTDAAASQAALASSIVAGVSAGTYTVSDPGFSVSPGSLATAPTISSLALSPTGQAEGGMLDIATKIVTWLKTLIPAAPCGGTHSVPPAVFTGSATATAIK